MAVPYIPAPDAGFNDWLVNFETLLAATPTAYGLTAPDIVPLTAAVATWSPAYADAVNPSTRTAATIAAKDAARGNAEAIARPLAIRVRNNASVSDALKIGLGVTVQTFPPTPIPAPSVAPTLSLISAISLEQTLSYKDPGAVGKAKPFGSIGIEIYRSVGVAFSVDPVTTTYQATMTKSPFKQVYLAGDQGKKVTLFGRFVTRSGPGGVAQAGPWSDPLNLTVM